MIPFFQLIADSRDVTNNIRQAGLISLSIRDLRGQESDSLDFEVNDIGGRTFWPRKNARLQVAIGYRESGLVPKGLYIVDEVSHSGAPDRIIVQAKAANMLNGFKVPKTRSWHDTTLGQVIRTIAEQHELEPAIAPRFENVRLDHIDQNESDMNFITRLGKKYDAAAKPAGGRLVFVPKGAALTASGRPMPIIPIHRSQGDGHRLTQRSRTEYSGVRAGWTDVAGGQTRYVTVGTDERMKNVAMVSSSEAEARDVATAELQKLGRHNSELEITLKQGMPELVAEMGITLSGWREEFIKPWVCKEVTHTLSGSAGLNSTLQLEEPSANTGSS